MQGRIDTDTLKRLVADDEIETIIAAFPDMYGRLVGKRLVARFFVDEVMTHGLHACDYLLACDMDMDPVPGYAFTSWAKGYGDFRPIPDFDTLRIASWQNKTALVLCDVYHDTRHELVPLAPRSILRKQLARAAEQKFSVMAASELELYVFKDSYETAAEKGFIRIEPLGRVIEDYHILQGTKEEFLIGDIRSHLERSGIPVESSKGEWGPGQQEIGLRYADGLEMADRHVLYKHAAKEIAWKHGCAVTFMAKWDERYAGSSCHIHMSLWDANGKKAMFDGKEQLGPIKASSTFRYFLGGCIMIIKKLFAFYAPYPASYKRAFAATIAAGLDGIEHRIEPPPAFEGDVYAAQDLPHVPHSLNESIHALAESDWARGVLGEDVVDHYLHFFRTEQRKFDTVVTDWERRRYFEMA